MTINGVRGHRSTGRAEDGALVAIVRSDGVAVIPDDLWPPIGLTVDRVTVEDHADLRIELLPGAEAEPTVVVDGVSMDGGWMRLESELSLFAADHLVGRVAVHAGVVVVDGQLILLPGSSHAGKSTLCLALRDAGATVLSDEYAVVDPGTGLVVGWPRPMRRRRPDGTADRIPLEPTTLGPLPVGLVASLRHRSGEALVTTVIAASEITTELLANTVSAQRHPDLAFTAALAVARSATGLAGTRGEADEAAAFLIDLLTQST